jgi:hypothetical protein
MKRNTPLICELQNQVSKPRTRLAYELLHLGTAWEVFDRKRDIGEITNYGKPLKMVGAANVYYQPSQPSARSTQRS